MTRANGSANTVTASRKETPCFLRLDAALFGSHVNSISVILLVADSKGSGPLLFAGLAGLAKAEPNQNRRGFLPAEPWTICSAGLASEGSAPRTEGVCQVNSNRKANCARE